MADRKIRVGECFTLGFRGLEPPEWLLEFEKRYGLGGVILFDYNCQTKTYENNIQSPEQVKVLCQRLGDLPSHPLLMVDQEGGKVRRLKEKLGFAPLPSAAAFNQLEEAEKLQVAEKSFSELRSLGFHFNLAPVIDANFNPENPDIGKVERSFSASLEEVKKCARVQGLAAARSGLHLCLKHFPGLGGAKVNSHLELINLSDTIDPDQLELFFELGKDIPSVLVSHGIVDQWEKDIPVSTSKKAISLLRSRLPEALLFSDDLQMQALQQRMSTEEGSILGLKAGLDLIIVGNNLMAEDEKLLAVAERVQNEIEKDSRLRAGVLSAIGRVVTAKAKFRSAGQSKLQPTLPTSSFCLPLSQ